MPARDLYHDAGRNALAKDGWRITHDPYRMTVGQRTVYVDLGANRIVAAERGDKRIAVEVKTFQGPSDIADLEQALGQYVLYRSLLRRSDPDRRLYLAIPQKALLGIFQEPIALPVLEDLGVALLAFDPAREEIVAWKD
jgi:hypothetical protein